MGTGTLAHVAERVVTATSVPDRAEARACGEPARKGAKTAHSGKSEHTLACDLVLG